MGQRKIVLIIDSFPPHTGGMETHAFEFARFLKSQNTFECVGVIAFSDAPNQKASFNENVFPTIPTILPASALFDPTALANQLRQFGIGPDDSVFFNTLYWIRILPALKQQFPETLFIQRSGGNDIVQAPIKGAGETLIERQLFVCTTLNSSVTWVIVPSEYSKNRLIQTGINDSLIKVIVGGVDIDRFKPCSSEEKIVLRRKLVIPLKKKIILGVSRLVSFKGIEYVLNALAILKSTNQECRWHYILVGDGPNKNEYLRLRSSLGLGSEVTFVGEISPGRIHEYYAAADIFCHAPIHFEQTVQGGEYIHTESMGRCLLEACASGLPVITTNVGGIHEIIQDQTNGILIPEREPARIAETLKQMLESDVMCVQMGNRGRQIVEERFSWHHVFDEYITLLGSK